MQTRFEILEVGIMGQSMQSEDRPSVLIICNDQYHLDCLGCCGNPDVKTPNL